jgi:uncharacterized membrane protein HdeD (DUF308 family)
MIEKIIGKVKGFFNKVTIMDLIMSIIYVIVGIIFIIVSKINTTVLAIIMGLLLVANAIISIYSFIKNKDISLFKNNLIFGFILFVVGLLTIFIRGYLAIVIGIYLIVVGIQKVNYGLILKQFNESSWLITLVMGIILVAIAGLTIFTNISNIVRVSSIYLIGYGIINFTSTILLRKRSQYFL